MCSILGILWLKHAYTYQYPHIMTFFRTSRPFLLKCVSVLHIFLIVWIRSNGKNPISINKRWEITNYTLKISFCILTNERFRKIKLKSVNSKVAQGGEHWSFGNLIELCNLSCRFDTPELMPIFFLIACSNN